MDLPYIVEVFPRLLPGLWVTVQVSLLSLALAILIGVWLGTVRAFLPDRNPLSALLDFYVFLVRGTPIIVQIYVFFFVLPEAGLRLDPFWIGVIALTFNSGGYQIEIARAAVGSVDRGQFEGALAVGLSKRQTVWLVVLPQALRRMIAPITNEMSQLVKASSVLSVITVFELHKAANAILSGSYKFVELLTLQAVLYLALILSVSAFARWIETRVLAYGEPVRDFSVR